MNEQDVINAAIRSSVGAWFETNAKIFPKDRSMGLIRPKQNFLQAKIQKCLDRFDDLRLPIRLICLKPRQKGSTTFLCAVDYHYIRRHAASAVIIGGQYSQTAEAWSMLQTYAQNDSFKGWGNTGEINSKAGTWSNGSKLKPETAKDAVAGISGTYQVLHATECARWSQYGVSNAAGVMANILKCVPLIADSVIVLESTAEGSAGDFYERWMGAIDAEDFFAGTKDIQPGSFVRCFAPWYEFEDSAFRLTEEQQENIKNTLDSEQEFSGEQEIIDLYGRDDEGVLRLGSAVTNYTAYEALAWRRWAIKEECKRDKNIFERDYPSSWRGAFQKSGKMRFNAVGLEIQRRRLQSRPTPQRGVIEEAYGGRYSFRGTEDTEAKIIIFEKPTIGFRYIVSVDPATGASQTAGADPDNHGVFCLRAGYFNSSGQWVRPATAARVIQNMFDPDVLEVEIWRLAKLYGGQSSAKIILEVNQERGLIELLKLRGADFYMREAFNKREFKVTSSIGYSTNVKTRAILIDTLAAAIREWDKPGAGIDIWCPQAIEQCENFVVKPNGRAEAAENHHDDDVFSIALGLEVIEQAKPYIPERGVNGWWGPPQPGSQSRAGVGSQFS